MRRADDPLIVDSLKVVDAVLKRDLPQGPGWLRYNYDGYGQRPDGGPYQGWGQGRVWPLLTGERAHYELAAGNDIAPLSSTYEDFATCGQMLPEQVWDEPDLPEASCASAARRLRRPLVWAHAEYLKLLRSAIDGKVFDRIDPVYERYCAPDGRKHYAATSRFYSRRRPIQTIAAGNTLRILDDKPFRPRLDRRRLANQANRPQPQPWQRRVLRRHSSRIRNRRGANGLSTGRNRTPGLGTILKSRLMPFRRTSKCRTRFIERNSYQAI